MFYVKKSQVPILIVHFLFLTFYTVRFLSMQNYEFLLYVAVVIGGFLWILATNKKMQYSNLLLWGLTAWSFLHMSGGGIFINGDRLYGKILLPIVSDPYFIFRYDQFVHFVGFGFATLLIYEILKPILKPQLKTWGALSFVLIMAGLGLGAINEIIEFLVTTLLPQTGVGGYINTALDLVFDFLGALFGMLYIRLKVVS
ncbi:DUF2238 domain-containing protein [Candidatus Peregrinibacteria bacterium]|nr:MAG: DUF2238 domain-containing protein [Candidatus Peregrinibacteria bacterium]